MQRWEQVAGPGCHGRAFRRRAPAGLVSSAGPAAAATAPGSTATWPTAALPRVDEARGRLTTAWVAGVAASSRALRLRGLATGIQGTGGRSAACPRPRGGARVHGMSSAGDRQQ